MGIKSWHRESLLVSNPVQGKGSDVLDSQEQVRFETLVLPHLDAAFNLARWLLRSRADAEDAAQEALLRAYRFFYGFHGGDARAWLLQIVRNTCYTWLDKNRKAKDMTEFNEEVHGLPSPSPETLAIASNDRDRLSEALKSLPPRDRGVHASARATATSNGIRWCCPQGGPPWRVNAPIPWFTVISITNWTRSWPPNSRVISNSAKNALPHWMLWSLCARA